MSAVVTPRKPDTKDGVYFDDPALPEGWTRKCVQRATGESSGKWDVYVYNPMGKKFRSQNEVRRYLEQINSDISPELFCFNAHSQAGMPSARRRTPGKVKAKAKLAATKILSKARGRPKKAPSDGAGDAPNRKMKLKFNFPRKPAVVKKPAGRMGRPPKARPLQKPPPPPKPQRPTKPQPVVNKLPVAKPQSAAKPQPSAQKGARDRWSPPESPYELVQERYWDDPWKLLVACMVLSEVAEGNPDDTWGEPGPVVSSRAARPLLEELFQRWPTAAAARDADSADVRELLTPLQVGDDVAAAIVRFSDEYANKKYKSPTELEGVGRLGSDSYRLFCLGQWKQVRPQEHMLCLYHNWIWTNHKALRVH